MFTDTIMKFILVEDDTEIVEFISIALDLGWSDTEIIAVNQGKDVATLIESESPDLVLLDLGLPDISGFDVLREIRQFSNIPVIIITVSDSEESILKDTESLEQSFLEDLEREERLRLFERALKELPRA